MLITHYTNVLFFPLQLSKLSYLESFFFFFNKLLFLVTYLSSFTYVQDNFKYITFKLFIPKSRHYLHFKNSQTES